LVRITKLYRLVTEVHSGVGSHTHSTHLHTKNSNKGRQNWCNV